MFKTITSVLDPKKTPKDEDIQKIQPFIFCKWLSGNPITILAANQLNYYIDIPIENQYHLIKNAFAGKIKYIPYPKKEQDLEDQKLVGYLSKFFKINTQDAKEYLELIDSSELEKIIKMYEK